MFYNGNTRVKVLYDPSWGELAVYIHRTHPTMQLLDIVDDGIPNSWKFQPREIPTDDSAQFWLQMQPTFRIPEGLARVFLAALVEYFRLGETDDVPRENLKWLVDKLTKLLEGK